MTCTSPQYHACCCFLLLELLTTAGVQTVRHTRNGGSPKPGGAPSSSSIAMIPRLHTSACR
jgi:hypothetical protein